MTRTRVRKRIIQQFLDQGIILKYLGKIKIIKTLQVFVNNLLRKYD